MQVFTNEFIAAVKSKLESIQEGFYMTREQLCISLGVAATHSNAISMLLAMPEFAEFEAVKSRGIRRRKLLPAAVAA